MATPWKEHVLDEIAVVDGDVGDAATCLLHTVLFTRAPGPVRPSEATCHAFPGISYSLCAVGDVSRKVEHAVKSFEESVLSAAAGVHNDSDGGGAYGAARAGSFGSSQRLSFGGGTSAPRAVSAASSAASPAGCLVVAFFERKIEKALFGLMSNEEKIYFEKWVVPIRVAPMPPSPAQYEAATRETEAALQHALLHILAAVQHVDHVSSKMYDFEPQPVSVREQSAHMDDSDVVSPPLATSRSSPAPRCRPPFSARHTRASCISFAAASGRDDSDRVASQHHTPKPRPTTMRPGTAHRVLTLASSTQWHFLTKTAAEESGPGTSSTPRPSSSRASRLRARPVTARVDSSSTAASSPAPTPTAPKRPATCRGPRNPTDPSSKAALQADKAIVLVDPRVIQEAARHETEQELYTGPLVGKSVEIQQPDLLAPKPFRDSRVVNAVSRSEFHRGRAFQARAKGDQQSAIEHLEKLLELLPDDQVALFQLAVAYEKTGRLNDAQATYNRVLPLDASNPFLHYNIGNLLMKMDLVEDAIAAYSTAIQMGGSGKCQNLAFYRQRGAAYRKNGDFEKAAQDYARVHTVHHRRRSLTADASGTKPAPTARQASLSDVRVSSQSDDMVADGYSAEPIYSASHFAAHCTPPEQSMTTVELLDHRKAMAIAAKPSHARTDEELLMLSDRLARCFPCCAALDPEARKQLSARVVAGANLPRGAMLVQEGTRRGDFMFFVARGRISVYKRFAPRVVASFNDNQEAEKGTDAANPRQTDVVSWEVLCASVHDDPVHSEEEKEEVFQSMTKKFPVVDLESWCGGGSTSTHQQQVLLTHLSPGDVCGRQGRLSQQERLYSAVVSDPCDFFAVSWVDFLEVERLHRLASSSQLARFFGTVPLFHGFSNEELIQLSQRARNRKVVGERVICTEGQHVNGLIIVREGQLCQLYPSELSRPPNLSVAFSLSGSISMNERDAEHGGLHFFTQLEHSDDPLLFIHDSALMHGFLAHDFLPQALARMSGEQLGQTDQLDSSNSMTQDGEHTSGEITSRTTANGWKGATNLARGSFFNASSSWIPPRKSRRQDLFATGSGGVSCAKTALITTETCELIFFTASDLTLGLSMKNRALLQKNMQQINARRTDAAVTPSSRPSAGLSSLRRLVFLKPPSGGDLVRKFQHDTDWKNYKEELVSAIVADARQRRSISHAPREALGDSKRPASARSEWKR